MCMTKSLKPIAKNKRCLQCGDIFGLRLVEGKHMHYYFCPKHDPAFIVTQHNNVKYSLRAAFGFEEIA